MVIKTVLLQFYMLTDKSVLKTNEEHRSKLSFMSEIEGDVQTVDTKSKSLVTCFCFLLLIEAIFRLI